MNRFCVALFCLLSIPLAAPAQTRSAPPVTPAKSPQQQNPAPADYSQEPFVIEQYVTTARFENDGTGEKDLTVRIRVQSEVGAKQLTALVFAYNSANDQIDLHSLRVH